ncbi:MAG: permease prefix domain 2-containing transporter [Bacteroidia bacterium]|nr:permease prefix domain 2-containing transporter [Bacteroidia bacterium]
MKKTENTRPPGLALGLFRGFCHPDFREEIEGDLQESFHRNVEDHGVRHARKKFWWDVLLLFRPEIIVPIHFFAKLNFINMKKSDWLLFAALNLLLVFLIVVPFLPGPPNKAVIGLSGFSQLLGVFGMILIPLGVVWAMVEYRKFRQQKPPTNNWNNGFYFAILTGIICLPMYVLPASVATYAEGLWAGVSAAILLILALWKLIPQIRKLRHDSSFKFNPTPLYLLSIPLISLVARLLLTEPISDFSRQQVITQSETLITAIEAFKAQEGQYPETLEDLTPTYLNKIPRPSVMGVLRFEYEKTADAYNLSFNQWLHFGATQEVVLYNKNDQQLPKGYFASFDTSQKGWRYYWFD